MYNSRIEDSQEHARVTSEHAQILRLLEKRQKIGHTPTAVTAAILDSIALVLWGIILRDTHTSPSQPPTRAYLAFLALSSVIALAASTATLAWGIAKYVQRLTAESDRLKAYDEQQLVKRVTASVLKSMNRARLEEKYSSLAVGINPPSRPHPGGENSQVIHLRQPR